MLLNSCLKLWIFFIKEANYDMLNLAKLVWPNGITGTIVLG